VEAAICRPSDDMSAAGRQIAALKISASFDPATQHVAATFSIPPQSLSNDSLAEIIPLLVPDFPGDLNFTGTVQADGHYKIEDGKHSGAFRATARNFILDWPEKEIYGTNVYATLSMPELPVVSRNSFAFGFNEFRAGKIELGSGMSRFRYLPPDFLFMDSLTLDWCDGKIRAESTRFSISNQTARVVLHGDRVRLSKLLGQLGMGEDGGQAGFLSGIIPVNISREKITFRDAFLYSTPGMEGSVKLTPSEHVAQTASAVNETALVVDALSDFTYQWLRLGLNTNGEDLVVRFELDGKPSNNLFYIVGAEGVQRSAVANKFEGLTLDARITFPLNTLLPFLTNPEKLLTD